MNYYLPILLVIGSEVLYHTSSKATPDSINPLASIAISYIVGMIIAFIFYFITSPVKNLAVEYSHLNWSAFTLGIAVILMELGYIMVYKVGWDINVASLICNASLALILIVLGALFYKESLTARQLLGVAFCLLGFVLILKRS